MVSILDIFDLLILILTITWAIYWVKYFIIEDLPILPIEDESEFTRFVSLISTDFFTSVWLSAFLSIFI